mmetsp:Transcript_68305/g.209499  ORF Transcript_68305/g.209499 Transcript_68305/m.209499 type:complete len:220 (+) Transcript_68305:774-1433(+)
MLRRQEGCLRAPEGHRRPRGDGRLEGQPFVHPVVVRDPQAAGRKHGVDNAVLIPARKAYDAHRLPAVADVSHVRRQYLRRREHKMSSRLLVPLLDHLGRQRVPLGGHVHGGLLLASCVLIHNIPVTPRDLHQVQARFAEERQELWPLEPAAAVGVHFPEHLPHAVHHRPVPAVRRRGLVRGQAFAHEELILPGSHLKEQVDQQRVLPQSAHHLQLRDVP